MIKQTKRKSSTQGDKMSHLQCYESTPLTPILSYVHHRPTQAEDIT